MEQSKAKIFLAERRIYRETSQYRRYNSINGNEYANKDDRSFAQINAVNDETLAGAGTVKQQAVKDCMVMLLPVVGAVCFRKNNGKEEIVYTGQVKIIFLRQSDLLICSNPYEHALVNFLHIKIDPLSHVMPRNKLLNFNLQQFPDSLIPVNKNEYDVVPKISIGIFNGRQECTYNPYHYSNNVFAFVIQGVFEVHGRLLQQRDGLGLWNTRNIEMEALGNQSIILFIETPAQ